MSKIDICPDYRNSYAKHSKAIQHTGDLCFVLPAQPGEKNRRVSDDG